MNVERRGFCLKTISILHPFLSSLARSALEGLWWCSVLVATLKTLCRLLRAHSRLCLRAQSEPKGFTSAAATHYSAYGVGNNSTQKYPSFPLSIFLSGCCCAVFTPPDCRLLTLLRYPDSGMLHPTLCSYKEHSALLCLLEMTLLFPGPG